MAESTMWWIVTGVLVAAELLSGTFYLLMLAIGTVAGALAAHLGVSPTVQLTLGALVGGVAAALGYLVRRRRPGQPPARAERSVNLDVGEVVQVEHWQADGTALIRYRGAPWTAMLRPGAEARPGPQRVVELVGSRLLVEPV